MTTSTIPGHRHSAISCMVGGTCFDAAEALHTAAALTDVCGAAPSVWRCPNAAAHPSRPLHLGRRPATPRRSAA